MSRYPQWIQNLWDEVIERDDKTCVNCGRSMWDVHHIIPKGRKAKHSPEVWRRENMCCICRTCHNDGQTVRMRVQLLQRMEELYEYDMAWAQDEVVMEEVT